MKKIILMMIPLLMMLRVCSATVVDNASLLKENEFKELSNLIKQVENKQGIKIEIITEPSLNGKHIKELSKVILRRIEDRPDSGINGNYLLMIDMEYRKFHAVASSELDDRLFDFNGNPKFNEEVFINNFKQNHFSTGLKSYITEIDKTLDINSTETVEMESWFDPAAMAIAIVGGIIIAMMYRSYLISSMSNVRAATTASEYLDDQSINIIENQNRYLYTQISRRPKSQGNGKGGNGNSGGHGGSF